MTNKLQERAVNLIRSKAHMARITCTPVPATWQIASWPADVWPFTPSKARTLVKLNRDELTRCGAVVRPGQQLVFIGAPYLSWLQKKSARVNDYDPSARMNARLRAPITEISMTNKLQERAVNLIRKLAEPLDYDDSNRMLILLDELNADAKEFMGEWEKNRG